MTAAVAIASDEQYRVLRTYASGADLRATAASCSVDLERVSGMVELVGFDRGRARHLVAEYDRARRTPPPVLPAVVKENPVEKPEIVVTPEPSYESLLDRAERSGDPKLQKLAEKARELLDDLDDRLTAFEQAQEALSEIAELEAKLEAARAKLVSRRPPQRAERAGPDPKAVREWAAENGIKVPTTGRVQQAIVDRYLAARGGRET